jgi:ATP-binding cassette subfamily B protein
MSLFGLYIRSLRYLSAARFRVSAIVIANIVLASISVAEPIIFGRIIDAITDKTDSLPALAAWIAFAVFNTVAFVLVAREADRLAHARRADLLADSYGRFLSMPLSWHNARGSSNVLHTLLRASDTLFGLWLEFMRSHLATVVALALLLPTAASMDIRLTSVLVVLGVAYWAIQGLVMSRTRDGQTAVEGHYHTVFSHISDTITNVSVIHSYNRLQAETAALTEYVRKLVGAQAPVLDWWALASALNRMASTLSMLVILVAGTALVQDGEMKVGQIIAFIGFANLLISRLDQMRQFATQAFEARSKLDEFYALEDDCKRLEEPEGRADLENVRGHIEFRDVSFGFAEATQGISDVNFAVEAGTTVAIVGPTGAGKTTLVNLLQRIYEPQQGAILIDGKDISTVSRHSLRQCMATVFQDAGLLNRTIRENLQVGKPGSTDAELQEAAGSAAADDFIASRPAGWETVVGERGNRLSGGERQRLAIARAILKQSPILILDEATSALDVETEAKVKTALDDLTRDRTTFIIAHRLSTIREADIVIFMDHGTIVEMGSYDELAAKGGRFAKLLEAGHAGHGNSTLMAA